MRALGDRYLPTVQETGQEDDGPGGQEGAIYTIPIGNVSDGRVPDDQEAISLVRRAPDRSGCDRKDKKAEWS